MTKTPDDPHGTDETDLERSGNSSGEGHGDHTVGERDDRPVEITSENHPDGGTGSRTLDDGPADDAVPTRQPGQAEASQVDELIGDYKGDGEGKHTY